MSKEYNNYLEGFREKGYAFRAAIGVIFSGAQPG
jgi:hypothetical protein